LAFSFTDYPLAQTMIDRYAAGVDVAGVYENTGSETEGAELRTFFCGGCACAPGWKSQISASQADHRG